MNKKVLSIASLFVASAAIFVGLNKEQKEGNYTPLTLRKVETQGAKGAMEYQNTIKKSVITGKVEFSDLNEAAKFSREAKIHSSTVRSFDYGWSFDNPSNVGGRVRGIAITPGNDNILYAGGVSGGLFKSTDRANSWNYVEGFDDNLMVSTIEVMSNGDVYVGTGNSFENPSNSNKGSGFYGNGLYVSKNGGNSFDRIDQVSPSSEFGGRWSEINDIEKSKDENYLFIASNGDDPVMKLNLSDYNDLTTPTGLPTGGRGNAIDVVYSDNIMTVSVGNTVYISRDAGNQWNNFYTSNGSQRVATAISPVNTNYIYLLGSSSGGSISYGALNELIRTTDGGNTWEVIMSPKVPSFDPFVFVGNRGQDNPGGQGWYDLCVTASPVDENKAFFGGIYLFGYDNGNYYQLANQSGSGPTGPYEVHADLHSFTWDSQNRLYIGTDGGVFVSDNQGETYASYNFGFTTSQFYGVATKGDVVLGGTQDNGCILADRTLFNYTDGVRMDMTQGGDGFTTEISSYGDGYYFLTSQYGVVESIYPNEFVSAPFYSQRVRNQGTPQSNLGPFNTQIRLFEDKNDLDSKDSVIYTLGTVDTLLPGEQITYFGKVDFYPQYYTLQDTLVFARDESNQIIRRDSLKLQDKAQSMLAAGFGGVFGTNQGVWITRDNMNLSIARGDAEWIRIDEFAGSDLSNSQVSTMEWSADGNNLYVGLYNGALYRFSGLDSVYSIDPSSPFGYPVEDVTATIIYRAPSMITSISIDRNDSQRLVVTNAGTGSTHIRECSNALTATSTSDANWSAMDYNLPTQLPVYSSIIDRFTNNVIVGTEFGIYVLENGTTNWIYQTSFDKVPVYAFRQNWRTWDEGGREVGRLIAATHGRGIWMTDDNYTGIEETEEIEEDENTLLNIFPNPSFANSNIEFNSSISQNVLINVYDLNGKLVDTKSVDVNVGTNSIEVNSSNYNNGIYIINLTSENGVVKYGKLIKK